MIEEAKKNGIETLYNSFEIDRKDAINLFLINGFQIVEFQKGKKFEKETNSVLVKLELHEK